MLYLRQNVNNEMFLTCSRNKTLNNPTYLFNMYHKQSGRSWSFIPYVKPSSVNYNPRYDTFYLNIDDSIPQSLTGNTTSGSTNVHLIKGDYWLTILEQVSTTNLDLMKSYDVVLEQFTRVVFDPNDEPTYGDNIYEYKIYE